MEQQIEETVPTLTYPEKTNETEIMNSIKKLKNQTHRPEKIHYKISILKRAPKDIQRSTVIRESSLRLFFSLFFLKDYYQMKILVRRSLGHYCKLRQIRGVF